MKKTIAEYAKEYLQLQGFDSVAWGDSMLIHEIAEYVGLKHDGWKTEKNILAALDRSKLFEKKYFLGGFKQQKLCRVYKIKGED